MIKRQRELLAETFVLRERKSADAEKIDRLVEAQKSLADATAESRDALRAAAAGAAVRGSMDAVLEDLGSAHDRMRAAVEELAGRRLAAAFTHEEAALSHLLKARRSVSRVLRQGQGSSECRQFAQKLRQAIRLPARTQEEEKEKESTLGELARAADELSREERAIEQEARNAADGARERMPGGARAQPSRGQGRSSSASAAGAPSDETASLDRPAGSDAPGEGGGDAGAGAKSVKMPYQVHGGDLAERQTRAADEGENLLKRLARHRDASELAAQRMRDAVGDMREAERRLARKDRGDAGQSLDQAARKLKRLSDHLRGLGPGNVAGRMDSLRRVAKDAAGACSNAGGQCDAAGASPGAQDAGASPGGRQNAAAGAETLRDWLDALAAELRKEQPGVARRLDALGERFDVRRLADDIRRAGKAATQGDAKRAAQLDGETAARLEGLAEDIDREKRRFVQGLLERLIAAEEQASGLNDDLAKAGAGTSGGIQSRLQELSDELLTFDDARLAELVERLHARSGDRSVSRSGGGAPPYPGGGLGDRAGESMLPIVTRLQELIAEVIRHEVLLGRDERVPDRYRRLVEQYFKALSDDLR